MDNTFPTRGQRLAARVRAVNRANKRANQLYRELTAIFEPLIGEKLFKADGGFFARIEKLLPNFSETNTAQLMIYRYSASAYSLIWVVKASEMIDDSHCTYHETSVYVGDLFNGGLTRLCPLPRFRTDYDADTIARIRREAEAAKKKYEDLVSSLHPFGEDDR